MAGLFFYWFAWTSWIVATFFLAEGKKRTKTAMFILVTVALSPMTIPGPYHINISLSFLFILFYAYGELFFVARKKLLYIVVVCYAVTFSYSGFLLYTVYDPVILWSFRPFVVAIGVSLIVLLLVRPFSLRLLTAMIGVCHGEVCYQWIVRAYLGTASIGNLAFFDRLSAVLLALFAWQGYVSLTEKLEHHFRTKYEVTPKSLSRS